MKDVISFYDERRNETYSHELKNTDPTAHSRYQKLTAFINEYGLRDKKCLEIGSARGIFQDLVEDYTGTDIAESVSTYYHKPYKIASGGKYPFEDGSFDVIWTIAVFEYIPKLQEALSEIKRLIRGGYVYFAPAWQCRPWAANGYPVRPYRDFNWWGKLVKSSIPGRNSMVWRAAFIFPKRFWLHILFLAGKRYSRIRYKKIRANWQHLWASDSDVCNSIDPHDAILWFESNGFRCLSHLMHVKAFFVRTGGLVFRKGSF